MVKLDLKAEDIPARNEMHHPLHLPFFPVVGWILKGLFDTGITKLGVVLVLLFHPFCPLSTAVGWILNGLFGNYAESLNLESFWFYSPPLPLFRRCGLNIEWFVWHLSGINKFGVILVLLSPRLFAVVGSISNGLFDTYPESLKLEWFWFYSCLIRILHLNHTILQFLKFSNRRVLMLLRILIHHLWPCIKKTRFPNQWKAWVASTCRALNLPGGFEIQ